MKKCKIIFILILVQIFGSVKGAEPCLTLQTDQKVQIIIHQTGFANSDTLFLNWWDQFYSKLKQNETPHHKMIALKTHGIFKFTITEQSGPFYFTLSSWNKGEEIVMLECFLAKPGDNINMTISDSTLNFDGTGAAKYRCLYQMQRQEQNIRNHLMKNRGNFTASTFLNYYTEIFMENDSVLNAQLQTLSRYKEQIDTLSYQIITADLIGHNKFMKSYTCYNALNVYNEIDYFFKIVKRDSIKRALTNIYHEYLNKIPDNYITQENKAFSKDYLQYLMMNVHVECEQQDFIEPYYYIKKSYEGLLRDKILTIYLLEEYVNISNVEPIVQDVLALLNTSYCRQIIKKLKIINTQAFNFSLRDTTKSKVQLSDFLGKVVFLDFWFTGCSGCVYYYNHVLAPIEREFENNKDVVFITISIDKDRERWIKSILSNQYTSPNIINLYTEGDGDNHIVISHYDVTGYPKPILIDKQGKIFSTYNAALQNKEQLVQLINTALNEY